MREQDQRCEALPTALPALWFRVATPPQHFSNCNVHRSLKELAKMEIAIHCIWSWAWDPLFLSCSQWCLCCCYTDYIFLTFTQKCIYWFLEREEERERNTTVRERHWLHPQPRYVLWLGIEPENFWYTRWLSNQLSHPARAWTTF